MAITFSLLVLAGTGAVLLLIRRRSRPESDRGGDAAVSAPPPSLPPATTAGYGRQDGPDPILPGEEGIPRWRRPSVQAARFSTATPRQTVYERFQAESPGLVLEPIDSLVKQAPGPRKPLRHATSAGRRGKEPVPAPRRNLASRGSA
jgi:hypothetical protein